MVVWGHPVGDVHSRPQTTGVPGACGTQSTDKQTTSSGSCECMRGEGSREEGKGGERGGR